MDYITEADDMGKRQRVKLWGDGRIYKKVRTKSDGSTYTVYGGNLGSSKLYNTTSISPASVVTAVSPRTRRTSL